MKAVLGALALLAAAPAVASASTTIRVALAESVQEVELRGMDIDLAEMGPCEPCAAMGRRADVVRAVVAGHMIEVDGRRATAFRLRSDRPIRLNGREYGGVLDLVGNGAGLAVVNELPLEDYLAGVLQAEAGERWPAEALRAQAIVSRTYAAYHRLINASRPYHIVASTANQQYAGRVPAGSLLWGAVQETTGQVLLWEGELFPAFYHADSGGFTENPRDVFGARNLPALKPVVSQFSVGSPHFSWRLELPLSEIGEALRRTGADLGTVTAIEVTERTPSLRATTVTVRGTRGDARLRGNDFRRAIGYDTLKSTLFAVAVQGGVAHFAGRGYGHGVGLCQWGARGMAEQGYAARAILAFFYPGTTLGSLDAR